MNENTFTAIGLAAILGLALRGFVQVFRPTVRAGRIRVTSVTGNEFWVPLWWRPFTLITTTIGAVVAIASLETLFR